MIILIILASVPVAAISQEDFNAIYGDYSLYQDVTAKTCSGGGSVSAAPGTALDYTGNPIFTQEQLQAITANQPFYEAAASKVDIPWQMIAVIHSNEHGLKKENPGNGEGIYGFYDKRGGPYPEGPVDDTEFQRQTDIAAQIIKDKQSGLTAGVDAAIVKDAFWGYNGRAYASQAAALGFPADQGYEGSPYVMNKADARRDPAVNPTTWGQVKHNLGPIEYPANNFFGAFVQYAALAGISTGSCLSGPVRQKVIQLLQQELESWKNSGSADYSKYSQGRSEAWCADFATWIYKQGGQPLTDSNEGNIASVQGIWDIGQKNEKFHAHPVGTGYQPKPGDIVIYGGSPLAHTEIVTENKDGVLTVISGNWGGAVAQHSYPVDATNVWSGNGLLGYVSPD